MSSSKRGRSKSPSIPKTPPSRAALRTAAVQFVPQDYTQARTEGERLVTVVEERLIQENARHKSNNEALLTEFHQQMLNITGVNEQVMNSFLCINIESNILHYNK